MRPLLIFMDQTTLIYWKIANFAYQIRLSYLESGTVVKHLNHDLPTEIRTFILFVPPQAIATDSEVSAYPKILLHKLLWYPKFGGSDSDGISQLLLVFMKIVPGSFDVIRRSPITTGSSEYMPLLFSNYCCPIKLR